MIDGQGRSSMGPKSPLCQGEIEYYDRQIVKGWAVNRAALERPAAIRVLGSGRKIGEFAASEFRWDLMERFHSSGNHGFAFEWPLGLVDDRGSFTFQFSDTGEALTNSPVRFDGLGEHLHAPFETVDLTGRRVLVLAPHPDDETLTCGGSLILHADKRDPVKVVFLTDGSQGDLTAAYPPWQFAAVRRKEAAEACAILGIADLDFLDFRDRRLAGSSKAFDHLCELLLNYRPALIYAPSPHEFHPDHRAAADLIWRAVTKTRIEADVAFYESNRPIHVNRLVDVSGVQERKRRACECYRSQLRHHPYHDVAISLSRYRALTVAPAVSHAEGFFLLSSSEMIGRPLDWFTVRQYLPMARPETGDRALVSIIIRTKDRPSLLREALSSVLTQTYPNIEVVLVNDGCLSVAAIAGEFNRFFPVTVVESQGAGRAAAANQGVKHARGKYLNFLDDDDLLYSSHIDRLVRFLEVTGERFAYSDCERVRYKWAGGNFELAPGKPQIHGTPYDGDRLYYQNFIPFMAAVFEKSLAEGAGGFDETLNALEDWDFWIRVSKLTHFQRLHGITARYRLFVERPHAQLVEQVHRKHIEDWVNRGNRTQERIQTLRSENAHLADALAGARKQFRILRVLLSLVRRLKAARNTEEFVDREEFGRGWICAPFEDWRKLASTPWSIVESLQTKNRQLRETLASIEEKNRAIRHFVSGPWISVLRECLLGAAQRVHSRIRTGSGRKSPPLLDQNTAIELRNYRKGDERQILELFRICFGARRRPGHWKWKYLAHPWGSKHVVVAVTPGQRIVANYSGYPVLLHDNTAGEPAVMTALQVGDTMTSPEARNLGRRGTNLLHRISQHYFAEFCEGRVGMIFGFNTGKIQRYYLKLVDGMRLLEEVPFMVLNVDAVTTKRLQELTSAVSSLRIKRVRRIGHDWDEFFANQSRQYGILTRRDGAYVRWRYLQSPDVDYSLYGAYDSGRLVGWSAFRQQKDRLIWGDGLFDREHAGSFALILLHALRKSGCGANSVEGWFSSRPAWWSDAVAKVGFERRPEPDRIGMLYKPFLAGDPSEKLQANLYYTKGDSDLF